MKNQKLYFIIGGSGRLGRALTKAYCAEAIIVLPRSVYCDWITAEQRHGVINYFRQYQNYDITIFITSGLLDPMLPLETLLSVNYWLPKNVIEGTVSFKVRTITFGTVMEALMPTGNNYITSKVKFSKNLEALDLSSNCDRHLHIQIHTLFGIGIPNSFMFLGQILKALQKDKPFVMTSGSQLREYHHIEDDVKAIRLLEQSGYTGIVDLSHGRPVSLLEIANFIFEEFDSQHLLKVGILPSTESENFTKTYKALNILDSVQFRDTLPSIASYIKSLVTKS